MPAKKPNQRPGRTPGARPQALGGGTRRLRDPAPVRSLADIPSDELTPRVESAVMRLMRELDRLKDELVAAQERAKLLETMADEDPLVPLLNRRGFLRELERALAYRRRYGGPASLVFIDLDRFKAVNDTHGHAAGDAVLKHVAGVLLANVRKSDLVGRIGGDEFAIVLQRADEAAASRKADQLAAIVAASPVRHGGIEIPVRVSAGVAEITASDTAGELLCRADAAMYARKARGKGAHEKVAGA